MTLNLPLLYWFWFVEYCQTSPNKSKSPNLWHVTSILVCCIFDPRDMGTLFLSYFGRLLVAWRRSKCSGLPNRSPDSKSSSLSWNWRKIKVSTDISLQLQFEDIFLANSKFHQCAKHHFYFESDENILFIKIENTMLSTEN